VNYAIDPRHVSAGAPCTMKYNPRINELVARIEGLAWRILPTEALAQGSMEVMRAWKPLWAEISGNGRRDAANQRRRHGELTGHPLNFAPCSRNAATPQEDSHPRFRPRPQPRLAAISGYASRTSLSATGVLDVAALAQLVDRDVAAAHGDQSQYTRASSKENIMQAAEICTPRAPCSTWCANMNALVGMRAPAISAWTCWHLNLHKTFSTPTAAAARAQGPWREEPSSRSFRCRRLKRSGKKWASITGATLHRPLRAFYGNFRRAGARAGLHLAHGGPRPAQPHLDAVLQCPFTSANSRALLRFAYPSPNMHEVVFSDFRQAS